MELPRALRRTEPELISAVPALLARIARCEIDDVVRTAAAGYPGVDLPSLDAVHLATAHAVFGGLLGAFVSYDRRLLAHARDLGLPALRPMPA